ncbi:hypothetical protein MMC30_006906 [Trapelia coarctata]|nr:hypothetical protein [Trapelia coarctata]
MSTWRNEYLSALRVRDSQEQATKAIYDAYTKLADRAASLPLPPTSASSAEKAPSKPGTPVPASVQVRQDLLEAQRSRGELQTRLDTTTAELERLSLRSKAETRRIGELTTERTSLLTKLRDKDEELRGKAKLLEEVHDENLSLTIELNMAEAQKKKLEVENKELVDRWMAQKGLEAEEMNRAGKFT